MTRGGTGGDHGVHLGRRHRRAQEEFLIGQPRSQPPAQLLDRRHVRLGSQLPGARQGFDPSQSGVPSGSGFSPFIGDYNGIVSLPTKAAFAWTGVGKPVGNPPINLDIFFGSVTP